MNVLFDIYGSTNKINDQLKRRGTTFTEFLTSNLYIGFFLLYIYAKYIMFDSDKLIIYSQSIILISLPYNPKTFPKLLFSVFCWFFTFHFEFYINFICLNIKFFIIKYIFLQIYCDFKKANRKNKILVLLSLLLLTIVIYGKITKKTVKEIYQI